MGRPRSAAAAWKPIFDDAASQFTVEETIEAGDHVVQLAYVKG